MSAITQTYMVRYGYMNERMDGWMDGYRGMMIKKLYDRCWTGAG